MSVLGPTTPVGNVIFCETVGLKPVGFVWQEAHMGEAVVNFVSSLSQLRFIEREPR
jgi:hypothetical protein